MLIWTRWGILALVIPVGLIVIAFGLAEVGATALSDDERPNVTAKDLEGASDEEIERRVKELQVAREIQEEKEQEAVENARNYGYLIGCLAGAGILWPLGRWMNQTESRVVVDMNTGEKVEMTDGGGHTFFFIPMQYWAFIWLAIGLYRFLR